MTPLLIGIDVGMTCTGVCYFKQGVTEQPRSIQKWPGSSAASSDKVITAVCYQHGRATSWGFQVQLEDLNDPAIELREWFKVALDEREWRRLKTADPDSVPDKYEHVKEAYRDYLRFLYTYIRQQLESTTLLHGSSWDDSLIEFLFSVPTTWTALGVTNLFKSLIHEAGFGSASMKHSVRVGLTEAEAAAVHTFATDGHVYSEGNVILIVDAGGGTTDLALLRVRGGELEQMDDVRGDEIGSVEIDVAFKDMVVERLRLAARQLNMTEATIQATAQRMVYSFKATKEDFGSDNSYRQPRKRIDVPGISSELAIPEARIERGGMYFTIDEIRKIFDMQMVRMFELLDYQMNKMAQVAQYDQITHLVLSGGLGSSEYVFREIRDRYVARYPHPHARSMAILRSTFPQAAPVRGLIQDRLRQLERGKAVLGSRKSRMSLGIVCSQRYDPKLHAGAQCEKDPVDGLIFAKEQVTWFVRKGDTITNESIVEGFHRTLRKAEQRVQWMSKIVKCDQTNPPRSASADGVIPICQMTSDLTTVPLHEFVKKKKHWYQRNKPATHYLVKYEIKFNIQPASIELELWFNGTKYNLPNSFIVEWDEGANIPAPKEHLMARQAWNNWDRRD